MIQVDQDWLVVSEASVFRDPGRARDTDNLLRASRITNPCRFKLITIRSTTCSFHTIVDRLCRYVNNCRAVEKAH